MWSLQILTAHVTNVSEGWCAATALKFLKEFLDSLDEIIYGGVILNV